MMRWTKNESAQPLVAPVVGGCAARLSVTCIVIQKGRTGLCASPGVQTPQDVHLPLAEGFSGLSSLTALLGSAVKIARSLPSTFGRWRTHGWTSCSRLSLWRTNNSGCLQNLASRLRREHSDRRGH
ncbi:hypothetical protein ACHAWF_001329 [Thalassiosira exigua]